MTPQNDHRVADCMIPTAHFTKPTVQPGDVSIILEKPLHPYTSENPISGGDDIIITIEKICVLNQPNVYTPEIYHGYPKKLTCLKGPVTFSKAHHSW